MWWAHAAAAQEVVGSKWQLYVEVEEKLMRVRP